MRTAYRPMTEYGTVDAALFAEKIAPAYRPAVLRGFARHWPSVAAARRGALGDHLRGFDGCATMDAFVGPPSGQFHYGPTGRTYNFERRTMTLVEALEAISARARDAGASSVFVGSTPAEQVLPGFSAANPNPILPADVAARLWLGGATTTQIHHDLSDNIAVVVAGRRRFTLFPPSQVANLYIGPLDFTPAGQPISLVRLDAPDDERFPRFREAERHAEVAELEPGDAIYIPALWWHHVQSLAPLNLLVNYWWRELPAALGSPFEVLIHGLMAVRHLPAPQRAAWRDLLDHYLFETNGDPAAHLPDDLKGVLGPASPQLARNVRAFLINALGARPL